MANQVSNNINLCLISGCVCYIISKYSEILANNTAFLTVISSVSLFINLIYVYVSNLECKSIMALNFISFFALYFIFLTIKIVVDDILFLSNIFKN